MNRSDKTLGAAQAEDPSPRANVAITTHMAPRQGATRALLELLADGRERSIPEIAAETGFSAASLHAIASRHVRQGLLEHTPRGYRIAASLPAPSVPAAEAGPESRWTRLRAILDDGEEHRLYDLAREIGVKDSKIVMWLSREISMGRVRRTRRGWYQKNPVLEPRAAGFVAVADVLRVIAAGARTTEQMIGALGCERHDLHNRLAYLIGAKRIRRVRRGVYELAADPGRVQGAAENVRTALADGAWKLTREVRSATAMSSSATLSALQGLRHRGQVERERTPEGYRWRLVR